MGCNTADGEIEGDAGGGTAFEPGAISPPTALDAEWLAAEARKARCGTPPTDSGEHYLHKPELKVPSARRAAIILRSLYGPPPILGPDVDLPPHWVLPLQQAMRIMVAHTNWRMPAVSVGTDAEPRRELATLGPAPGERVLIAFSGEEVLAEASTLLEKTGKEEVKLTGTDLAHVWGKLSVADG